MKRTGIILAVIFIFSNTVFAEDMQIKWVDFNVNSKVLKEASKIDIETAGTDEHKDWISIIAVLACENGNDFSGTDEESVDSTAENYVSKLEKWGNKKIYNYYYNAFSAVLSGLLGKGTIYENVDGDNIESEEFYGIRAFSPIASGYGYSHYDDFGASRDFGYKRKHLGHDIMCDVGTPIVAIEGGYVESCGWNTYGGWRIGIRSFDSKRYYYYAHLRKGHPYSDIYTGKTIAAGEIIGYAGMTGYSSREDTDNINVPHLHAGLELIFSPEQKDGYCQIWIDLYEITKFLEDYRVSAEYSKKYDEIVSRRIIISSDYHD